MSYSDLTTMADVPNKEVADALAEVGRLLAEQGANPYRARAYEQAALLEVDREYREKAASGQLYRITPRLQNPHRDAWLPVLHTHRGERHYTALFSNTPRAHQLGMTGDWVVIYYDGAGRPERQCTVITARFGPLAGQRVVRGREGECASHYAQTSSSDQPAAARAARRS